MYIVKRNVISLCLVFKKFKKFGIWKCRTCNNIAAAIVHQKRKTYCSKICESIDYKKRLIGNNNPNFKNSGIRYCDNCSSKFSSYNRKRKYCKHSCYIEYLNKNRILIEKPKREMVKKERVLKIKKVRKVRPLKECLFCKVLFKSSPSQNRVYCSYKCHIDSGGARRAGDAAVKAMKKYGSKKDANHKEIFSTMEKLTAVHDLSNAGFGIPDGMAWCGDKGWQLFDVKNPNTAYGRRGLNNRQKEWAKDWRGGCVYLIYNIEEAICFARGNFDGIKRFPE